MMERYAFDLRELAGNVVQSVLEQVGGLAQIKERPFETLFKYLVPGLLALKGHWVIGALLGAADSLIGIGPEKVGAMIDKAIGKGPGSGDKAIQESALESASNGIIGKLLGGLLSRSSALRAEVMRHGAVDGRALLAAWAAGPDCLEKRAYRGALSKLKDFLVANPIRGRGLLSGLFFGLLKSLLMGIGIHTGVGLLAKETGIAPGAGGSQAPKAQGMRLYTNPAGDVERSIGMALDNAVKDKEGKPFSSLFRSLKGYPPVGSQEMDRVLGEVRAAHGGAPLNEINGYKTFAAPPLAEIARMLLPQATYSKAEGRPAGSPPARPDAERELEGIFGGRTK
jgi:hypothetical protein